MLVVAGLGSATSQFTFQCCMKVRLQRNHSYCYSAEEPVIQANLPHFVRRG